MANYLASMTSRHPLAQGIEPSTRDCSAPLWFRVSALLLVLLAIGLLLLVLAKTAYSPGDSLALLVTVSLALAFAVVLVVLAWLKERKTTRAAELEFTAVCRHALNAILILNDEAICLDANPATFALLRTPAGVLIGHSLAAFQAHREEFEEKWRLFLNQNYQCGETQLVCRDGSRVFAHYTAAANYIPGRHVVVFSDTTARINAENSLRQTEERLRLVADNIGEIVCLMDISTKGVLFVNRACQVITGHSLESLRENPSFYSALIHPTDRAHILSKFEEAMVSGRFDEEFRILRPDHTTRWIWAKATPVACEGRTFHSLVGTAQDITARKLADAEVARHLTEAEAARQQADDARAEAEALRKATLAVTQNLRMDAVLDTLLRCLFEIIPYDVASVILRDSDGRLFVARESPVATKSQPVVTFESGENIFLGRVVALRKPVHVVDTREESEWKEVKALRNIRCWIAVPLVISETMLGVQSIGSIHPRTLSIEHLRLAKSLAIPAAVAIHNARLYEWAEIYAAERRELLNQRASVQDRGASGHDGLFSN